MSLDNDQLIYSFGFQLSGNEVSRGCLIRRNAAVLLSLDAVGIEFLLGELEAAIGTCWLVQGHGC